MKLYVIATLILTAATTGCSKPPETSTKVGVDFQVDKLFTHEGCTVYRFNDVGYRYFTNCKGAVEWVESCGKGCTRNQGVYGAVRED